MHAAWGSTILLVGPVLVLLVLRARGPVRPLVAYGSAIAAEYVSVFLFVVWIVAAPHWHLSDGASATVPLWSEPPLWNRLLGLAEIAALGAVVASVFLVGQWLGVRLKNAWSRRGV
jgi:hypothetical protein